MQPFTWGSETSWDMADTVSGDLTHFTLTPTTRVGCAESVSGKLFDLHITKQNPQDYWQAGLPGADIHWVMQQNANGDFQAVASLVTWADGVNSGIPHTIDYIWDAYNYRGTEASNSYLVLPRNYTKPVTRYGGAVWWTSDQLTSGCLQNVGTLGPDTPWTSYVVLMSNVSTKFYSGPALANEQYEGCAPWVIEGCNAAHEIWYFAPNVGLVEIDAVWEGVTIKRIN